MMTNAYVRGASPLRGITLGWRRWSSHLAAAAVLAGALAAPTEAPAQAYPNKSVRLIVPYAPGGGSDALARSVGKRLGEVLGQSFIIENRPGASGAIGTDLVAKSAPDGYTLLLVTVSHVINPAVMKSLPYDPLRDFTPITFVATSPVLIVSGTEQPFKTMPEVLAYVRARPGQVSIGNSDASSMLIVELLKQAATLDLPQIAYKGGGALTTDVIGNHIPLGAMSSGTAFPHYKSGKLRVLAVTPAKRTPSMPEVPTVAESGVPGFDRQIWFGLLGPAKLPAPVAERLRSEIVKILAEPAMTAFLAELGMEGQGTTPAETAATMRADTEVWATAARNAGIKPE